MAFIGLKNNLDNGSHAKLKESKRKNERNTIQKRYAITVDMMTLPKMANPFTLNILAINIDSANIYTRYKGSERQLS